LSPYDNLIILLYIIMGFVNAGLKKYHSPEEKAKRKARPKNNKLAQETIDKAKARKKKKEAKLIYK